MNLYLNCKGFETYLKTRQFRFIGGVQYLFKFDNDYGASVVKGHGTYGGEKDLWELAVIRWDADGDYELDYDTGIANDVIGYLNDEEVRDLLERIKKL